jgi:hypothetical protein
MKEHNVAGYKVIEINLPNDMVNKIKIDCLSQFNNFIANQKNQFRTPVNLDEPKKSPGYQWQAHSTPAIDEYKHTINIIVNDILKETYEFDDIWFLLQPFEPWINNPEHQHLTSEISITLYVNIIEGESSIEFFERSLKYSEKFYPKNGSILVWPSTAIHKPSPNISNYQRISLNATMSKKVVPTTYHASISDQRMNICKSCPQLTALNFCTECSCFMPLKTKILSAKCPLNKW